MEIVLPSLEIAAGILHSDHCNFSAPTVEGAEDVAPEFDAVAADVQRGAERLRLRDADLARDELSGALRRLRVKLVERREAPQDERDALTSKIRSGLDAAEWGVRRAGGNASRLPDDERLDLGKWILASEVLKVLNLLTSWNSTIELTENNSFTFLPPTKMKTVAGELRAARAACLKALDDLNDGVTEAAKFLAAKLPARPPPKRPVLKCGLDRKRLTVELLNINFLTAQFFRLLKTFFSFAVGANWKNDGQRESVELSASSFLVGLDPFVLAMDLHSVIGGRRLEQILRRETASRVAAAAAAAATDADDVKALRLRYVEERHREHVAASQNAALNQWMLTGELKCLRGLNLDEFAKDQICETLQDLGQQFLAEADLETLSAIYDTTVATGVRWDLKDAEDRVVAAEIMSQLIQHWLSTKSDASVKAAFDLHTLTRVQPDVDWDVKMKSGESKSDKLRSYVKELTSFYFEKGERRVLEGMCAALSWLGAEKAINKSESLNMRNGGSAEASTVYGLDLELRPGFVMRRLDCEAAMAFRDDEDVWISDDSRSQQQWITRQLKSLTVPSVFAMQANLGCCAPRDFRVIGRAHDGDEWKTVVEASEVEWRDDAWRFFVVDHKVEVKSLRMDILKTGGGGWAGQEFVQIKNIRMYS